MLIIGDRAREEWERIERERRAAARGQGRFRGGGSRRGGSALSARSRLEKIVAANAGMWLDWQAGVVPDTGSGATWTARVGGQVFSHATGAACPTYSTTTAWDFLRANSQFLSAAISMGSLWSTTQWHFFGVLDPRLSDSTQAHGAWTGGSGIFCGSSGPNAGIVYARTGDRWQAGGVTGGSTESAEAAYTIGGKQLWEGSYGSDVLSARTAAGTTQTQALVGPLSSLATAAVRIGSNLTAGDLFDGKIYQLLSFATKQAAQTVADIRGLLVQIETVAG